MEEATTMDVVVVFQRQEYYVSTQASADRSTLAVDLLQCQLLSLVGVMPDEQILLSPTGEVLYSPSKADVATIAVPTGGRPRFFLLSRAESNAKDREMAGDWTQICTKSTFGSAAVVQPAYRKVAPTGGDPLTTLICGPCARTCTTGFQSVSPMEWSASKKLASRFISEIAVVAGDVDVAAPSGFTKVPGDLNYSASGDYVYLCVKRGGPRALTQLHVLFDKLGDSSYSSGASAEKNCTPEKVVDVDCNSGGAAGDGSGMSVRIGFDSVQIGCDMEQLETLAITDIIVIVGDDPTPSSAYVKIPRNLNEGASGYRVARVSMWGGEFFDGLQFVYEKILTAGDTQSASSTAVHASLMGNGHAKRQPSQPTVTLELLPDEFISRVSGRKGAWTDSITLHTNFGRSISFEVEDHLTDIIAFVLEPSLTKALEGDTKEALSKTLSSSEPPVRQNAISAALRYLENIARQPEEAKFQRIRASNKFFASNVGTLGDAAAKSFMRWCGFDEISEKGDQFFIFQPSQLQDKPSPQRLAAEAHKRVHFLKNVGTH
ncbi:Peptide-N(4)-(N-acetyl-beta-glucosaminyl)asparagine amidase [Phytophthora cinnamomi]|uniref:Peptide-N(4)-(N-acetyl-beta- glucosaminyl)asparagine amidase n=1 Tax=Phytophthora cinnamomi TaxID=4785 RepID=UPI003559C9A2|nr:Peptide-N(4)-(N-acetyl-beta-glucosaminyl)asparagine amidase [Phytophthora cinnamomi]